MAPHYKYDQEKLRRLAKKVGIGYRKMRRRAKIFLNEEDLLLPAKQIPFNIPLIPGVISNRLLIIDGKPRTKKLGKNRKTLKSVYKVECQVCGAKFEATTRIIMAYSHRTCCARLRRKGITTKTEAAPEIADPCASDTRPHQPKHIKLIKHTAMQVRYYSTDIDGCLCNGCWHWLKCSDALYECECCRGSVDTY